ncbi:MAG: PAS domain-containing protein, partial [Candidatus Eremiobacteraeota bacterium]|nr:PAS domain-containing protein [Candidatus Eremiobacteraeota bacterium]
RSQLTIDAGSDDRFAASRSVQLYGIRSVMCVPLKYRDKLTGVIYVDSLVSHSNFDYEALDTLSAIANVAALALENARLFADLKAKMMQNLVMKNYQWAILHSVHSGILAVDPELNVTTINRAAQQILDLPSTEARGRALRELLPVEAADVLLGMVRPILEQRESLVRREVNFSLGGRGRIYLEVSVSPLREPGSDTTGATLILEDRTEQHRAEQARQQVQDLFGRLVSREVMEELLKEPVLELGGKRMQVTILLADINNFSSTCERFSPGQIIEMLNRYFSEVNEVIFRHRGMIKQFAGDEVLVLFGAPNESDDHAVMAVRTAIGIVERLNELVAQESSLGAGFYDVKVGVHTGEVVVGHVGSMERFEYAAVGDSVNLASRIMGLNKALGTKLLVSQATMDAARSHLPGLKFLHRGSHAVKGRSQEVDVYEVQSN